MNQLPIGFPAASNSGIRNTLAATTLVPGVIPAFGAQNQVSVEGIQEFSVRTSNYAAEFGQVGGAIFVSALWSASLPV